MASKAALKRTGKKAVPSATPPSRSGARQAANGSRRTQKVPKAAARTTIAVQGARVHNLKNISLEIPRDSLIVVTGLSGSGKSSLAFDTIYAEGQRRYMESLSSYAKRFVAQVAKPDVDFVFGLSPVISIEQKTIANNPRSTGEELDFVFTELRKKGCRLLIIDGKPADISSEVNLHASNTGHM